MVRRRIFADRRLATLSWYRDDFAPAQDDFRTISFEERSLTKSRSFWAGLGMTQFVSVAVLYSRLHDQAARYRNTAGTFIFADDDETFLRTDQHRKSVGYAMTRRKP